MAVMRKVMKSWPVADRVGKAVSMDGRGGEGVEPSAEAVSTPQPVDYVESPRSGARMHRCGSCGREYPETEMGFKASAKLGEDGCWIPDVAAWCMNCAESRETGPRGEKADPLVGRLGDGFVDADDDEERSEGDYPVLTGGWGQRRGSRDWHRKWLSRGVRTSWPQWTPDPVPDRKMKHCSKGCGRHLSALNPSNICMRCREAQAEAKEERDRRVARDDIRRAVVERKDRQARDLEQIRVLRERQKEWEAIRSRTMSGPAAPVFPTPPPPKSVPEPPKAPARVTWGVVDGIPVVVRRTFFRGEWTAFAYVESDFGKAARAWRRGPGDYVVEVLVGGAGFGGAVRAETLGEVVRMVAAAAAHAGT